MNMPIANREQYLDPDYGAEKPICHCDRCGCDMFEREIVYTDFYDNHVCEDCITEEVRDRSHELEIPEPDWDSMPGGADDCD